MKRQSHNGWVGFGSRVPQMLCLSVCLCVGARAGVGAELADVPAGLVIQPEFNRAEGTITLSWPTASAGDAYTVETRTSFAPNVPWLAVPESVWPIPAARWQDPLPASGTNRFYRVNISTAAATRGRLLASTDLGQLSTNDIQAIYNQDSIPLAPALPIRMVKLVYETINPFGLRTVGSGLLSVPLGTNKALPLVSYQHGTLTLKTDVPSSRQDIETVVGVAFPSSGYVTVLPDYLGLGDSPGLHPFLHAASEASAALDLLRAARSFCTSNAVPLNGQLFLVGYSEGGHATMALHREIEAHATNEFTVTASAPGAGPYDLSGVTAKDFLSDRATPNPYYALFILASYQSIYHIANSWSEILIPPYDRLLPPLLDGQHDSSDINAAIGTLIPKQRVQPTFLTRFANDPTHPLRIALQENDVYNWTPKAPLTLYHCPADEDVPYANSQVAYDTFRARGDTQVQFPLMPAFDHVSCAPWALLAAKLWFDTFLPQ